MGIINILQSLPKTILSSVIATLIFFGVLFYINDGWLTIDIFGALYLDTYTFYPELCG
jgi:hypothetical protein